MSSEAREGEAMSEYEKSVRENIQELHSTVGDIFTYNIKKIFFTILRYLNNIVI